MEFRLLGPVQVWAGGQQLAIGGGWRRSVLALLLLHANQVVSTERLIGLWGESPPKTVRSGLRWQLSQLRRALAAAGEEVDRLAFCAPGYRLRVVDGELDLERFRQLADQGRQAMAGGDAARAAELLAAALSLWRGRALDGADSSVLTARRNQLEQRRLAALEDRIEVDLRLGRHIDLVCELEELIAEEPLRERFCGQLMQALYKGDRQADALGVFQSLRGRLVRELGIEPSPVVQELHRQVLARDPALDWPASVPNLPVRSGVSVTPRQLPPDVATLVGRERELTALDHQMAGTGTHAAMVVAIQGTGGVGKTALAVHWAHRVADRFPDGQLYVNLQGFDPGRSPMPSAEAVRGFLDALAVEPHRIPGTPQAQVGLYRTLVADKRMLVVLDNARDSAQVCPLLPAGPGCMALVTSRNQLSSLVAAGAQLLDLDLLPATEARKLLANRLAERRLAEQQHAVEQIVDACAGLPLALAIVVARAAARPGLPLATLAEQLQLPPAGPDPWTGSDPDTDVWAVFSTSYHALHPEAARLFRMLGLHPGPDVTVPAAASLAGLPRAQTERLLTDLTDAHLLSEHAPGRFRFHDLLRAYATDLTHRVDTDADRRTARHRLLDHLVHTAHTAAILLHPTRTTIRLDPPRPAVEPEDHADLVCASTWLNAERAVLLSAITLAASTGFNAHVWQLAWTVSDFLDRQGRWHELKGTQAAALESARRVANLRAQALAHRGIANACIGLRLDNEAHAHLSQALDLFRSLADRVDQARTQYNLTVLLERSGRHDEALAHGQDALTRIRAEGDVAGQARALNAVGWIHAQLGRHQVALDHCQQALALQQDVGDRAGQALSWDSIGYAHHHLAHYPQAKVCYQRALALHREGGDHYHVARTLTHLGDTHNAANSHDAARDAWRNALTILDGLDHPDAARVRARLQPAVQIPDSHSPPTW